MAGGSSAQSPSCYRRGSSEAMLDRHCLVPGRFCASHALLQAPILRSHQATRLHAWRAIGAPSPMVQQDMVRISKMKLMAWLG